MAAAKEQAFLGRWVHAHEEDTDDEMVFRPAAHPLPPSRGRTSFELLADGTYVEISPGPVDAPEESTGRWCLDGDRVVLAGGSDRKAGKMISSDVDRLVMRKGAAEA